MVLLNVTFDATISIGNIITIFVIVGGIVGAYVKFERERAITSDKIINIMKWQTEHEKWKEENDQNKEIFRNAISLQLGETTKELTKVAAIVNEIEKRTHRLENIDDNRKRSG